MEQTPCSGDDVERVYSQPEVMSHYSQGLDVLPVEAWLFRRYVSPGDAVLDLGVGAGRTTGALLDRAGTYLANDITQSMVAAFRDRFPDVSIWHGDGTDLTRFDDGSFDVIVFSFNGIDHVLDADARRSFLADCVRVLSADGRLVLSRHNARCIIQRPRQTSARSTKIRIARLARALRASIHLLRRRLRNGLLLRGLGVDADPHHGGMRLSATNFRSAKSELAEAGFSAVDGPYADNFPKRFRQFSTPWFYLVATK